MIRRLNEIILTLLTHASLPPHFWVDALHTACYLHNILPTKILNFTTPMTALYHRQPSYAHLRIFGCACYPNTTATRKHKLEHRSTRCVFLGYPTNFRGYRCLDLSSGKVLLSRHVIFDETVFPFSEKSLTAPVDYSFLESDPPPIIFNPLTNFPPKYPPSTQDTSSSTAIQKPPIIHTYHRRTNQPPPSAPMPQPPTPSPSPLLPPPPASTHPMITRSRAGASKTQAPVNLHTTAHPPISLIPTSHIKALSDPHWRDAMTEEYRALMDNNTWDLVPWTTDANICIIRSSWLSRHKFDANGTLQRYKAWFSC